MEVRLVVGSLLFLAATAAAQQGGAPAAGPAAGTPAVGTTQPKQDPDKPQPTPAEEAATLQKEKDRLMKEIQYAQERATRAKALLTEKFAPSKPTWRAIDAGTMAQQMAAAVEQVRPIAARVASQDELKEAFGSDGMLMVNGNMLRRPQFDAVMDYVRTLPNSGDDNQRAQRILMDMIRTEVACSAFPDSEAMAMAGEVVQHLANGTPAAELVKKHGVVPGASPEGRLTITRNSEFGPVIEQMAFATKVGERTLPIRTSLGVLVLQVASFEKGASNELDKLQVDAVLVPLTDDGMKVQQVLEMAMKGQVQLVARDEATIGMLPKIFRPQATGKAVDPATLQATIEKLAAEVEKLRGATDDASKKRFADLEQQLAQTKAALMQLETVKGVEVKKAAVVTPPKDAEKKPDAPK
jgi:hypothetical protein